VTKSIEQEATTADAQDQDADMKAILGAQKSFSDFSKKLQGRTVDEPSRL